MLGDLYYGTLRRTGVTSLVRRLRQGALVVCYHNVVPDGDGSALGDPGLHLPVSRFTAQVQWLMDHYTIVPLRELAGTLERGRSLRGLAAITFDDGYAGAFMHAWPVLRALGLPATMFVVTRASCAPELFWWDHPDVAGATPDSRDRRLVELRGDRTRILADAAARPAASLPLTHYPADWSVIAAAAAEGLDIGAHTVTHRTLTTLDDDELTQEVASPRDIAERIGVRPACFSYPYGIWDARVRTAVHGAGYDAAVTLDYGLNTLGTDPAALRRICIPTSMSLASFAGWAAGIRPRSATLRQPPSSTARVA